VYDKPTPSKRYVKEEEKKKKKVKENKKIKG
jgi:hypothetical protein